MELQDETPRMHASELVELAALVAQHGPTLIVGDAPPSVVGTEEYWAASKCRFDRWASALARLRRGEPPADDGRPWTARGLIEEILGSEVLTRVWTAAVVAFDRRHELQDNEIIVRSVYIGHQEMRQRALRLLLGGPGIGGDEAVKLNRLRRRAEQWTDMLLAPLTLHATVHDLAFDVERLKLFAADVLSGGAFDLDGSSPAAFLQSTIRSLAQNAFSAASPNPDLNARVAAAVVGAFSPELFDSLGLIRSAWVLRMSHTAEQAQQMVAEMFRPMPTPKFFGTPARRFR